MRAFLFIAVVASLFYALDQSIKVQRQKRFAQIQAEKEEAQERSNVIYHAKVKAEAEITHKRLVAEEEERQRKLEAGMAKIEREFQEQKAQIAREAQDRARDTAAFNAQIAAANTPRASYNPYSNPMSPENMAAQGVNPIFWATPKPSTGATVITGSGGVFTTHGGAAGGATIIHQGAGHYMIQNKDGTTQQVIIVP
jgi:hypothetical protein